MIEQAGVTDNRGGVRVKVAEGAMGDKKLAAGYIKGSGHETKRGVIQGGWPGSETK